MSRSTIHFKCAACGGHLAVDTVSAGRKILCPGCSSSVKIPASSTCLSPGVAMTLLHGGVYLAVVTVGLFITWVTVWSRVGPHEFAAAPVAATLSSLETSSRDRSLRSTDLPAMAEKDERSPSFTADPEILPEPAPVDLRAVSDAEEKYQALAQWVLENVRGRYPVPERLVTRLRIDPVNDDFGLSEDVQELLHIEPAQRVLIDDALRYTKASLDNLELGLMQVAEMSDQSVTLYFPPYSDVGSMAREDLYLALEATLGTAKFDRLIDMTENELSARYHHFGEAERSLTFQLITPNQATIAPYMLIRDQWVMSEGESVRKTEVTETAVVQIPPPYQMYTPWLPPSLTEFATP